MKKLYVILFFVILSCPVLLIPIQGLSQSETSENRTKADFPTWKDEETGEFNTNYFVQVDEFLEDNFLYREQLIEVNSKLQETLFKTSAEPQVIVGQDGWLFATSTLDDYFGTNVLSDREIWQVAKTFELVNEYVTSKGAEFVFTIAPNKNSIYPQYMPSSYEPNQDNNNANKLKETLSSDIYLDLFEVMRNAEPIVYLARDSHWDDRGALFAYLAICEALDIHRQNFSTLNAEIKYEFEADLNGMLYPLNQELDKQIYYEFDNDFEYTSRFKSLDDIFITTESETGEGNILVFRDSFGRSLLQFFGRQFENTTFSRARPYIIDYVEDAEYIVIEIVEREIPSLLDSAPIMPAIVREVDKDELIIAKKSVINVDETNGFKHVYGYFQLDDYPENIYIKVNGILYEAFPIFEDSIEAEYDGAVGFSAYLPVETQNYKVLYR
ncbi:MAG: hypothetical protein ATN35_03385 [Epulopiscium sp. Nele67-Bin004]|nr:MAG: hypothetical protein ATN35_03385 [Epulopiscium sp. Nele67-Bin004]